MEKAPIGVQYYTARFQEEFLFRDGKQFTGLNQCQARRANKLEYHWNCSLTAINIAKVHFLLSVLKEPPKPFSMADVKTQCYNQLLLNRLFRIFENDTELQINNPIFSIYNDKVKELFTFGCIAA